MHTTYIDLSATPPATSLGMTEFGVKYVGGNEVMLAAIDRHGDRLTITFTIPELRRCAEDFERDYANTDEFISNLALWRRTVRAAERIVRQNLTWLMVPDLRPLIQRVVEGGVSSVLSRNLVRLLLASPDSTDGANVSDAVYSWLLIHAGFARLDAVERLFRDEEWMYLLAMAVTGEQATPANTTSRMARIERAVIGEPTEET